MSEKYYKGIKVCCENCVMAKVCHACHSPKNGLPCFTPSVGALKARIAELTAFVRKFVDASEFDMLEGYLDDEARALLREESEDGK